MNDHDQRPAPTNEAVRRRIDGTVLKGLIIAVVACVIIILAVGLLTIAMRS